MKYAPLDSAHHELVDALLAQACGVIHFAAPELRP